MGGGALRGWSADYLSPALQLPGYDAFPPALLCLLTALERRLLSNGAEDHTEARYAPALLAAMRGAVLHMLCLVEKLDYGRMKGFLDAKAEFLLEWLLVEAALQPPPPQRRQQQQQQQQQQAAGDAVAGSREVGAGSAVVWGGLRALQAELTFSAGLVSAAIESLTALFNSREKTIPAPLLQRYRDLAATR